MKISIIQPNLIWENPHANRELLSEFIARCEMSTDLMVLPEMFTTGFSMNPSPVAETMDGDTINWLKHTAKDRDCAITGSMIIRENDRFYNRLLFVHPSGDIDHYDKRHLFSLAGEHKVYTAGTQKKIVEYNGWKICLLICYDLRFPVFSRNVENYDMLIYVANWPEPRIHAWDTLLKARAIENMCVVVGANRIGADNNQHNYPGHSQIVDSLGNNLVEPLTGEGIANISINRQAIIENRQKFRFLNDRDSFTVI